jgi:hypothetical protein
MEILKLNELVEKLSSEDKKLFNNIFKMSKGTGELAIPPEMHDWIKPRFGEISTVEKQDILQVVNNITYEGALFNHLRSKRPIEAKTDENEEKTLQETKGCAFCDPLKLTPADTFGRVKGKHCITASNIAKYDGLHGLVIFDEHYPFVFEAERINDYLNTAQEWLKQAHNSYNEAVFPFIMWNCTWRAGASVIHGHMQTLLSETPYPKIEALNNNANNYFKKYNRNYWQDLFHIHNVLGLGIQPKPDINVMSYLTPIKEKELLINAHNLDSNLGLALAGLLKCYYNIGVRAFNLVIMMKPFELANHPEWSELPVTIRLVDRGNLKNKTTDIGAMELYACSVIETDPFKTIESLKQYI